MHAIKLFVAQKFCEENQESTMDENDFPIPIARLLHFVRTLNQ